MAFMYQETKKRRPSSARKPKRPAQRKVDKSKTTKDADLLSPADANHKDASDNPFEDPEKLYQVSQNTSVTDMTNLEPSVSVFQLRQDVFNNNFICDFHFLLYLKHP